MKFIDNQLKAKIVKLEDANNNFTSDNVEDALNEAGDKIKKKQDKLVSGTNIKTINGQSILGYGNIEITSSGGSSGSGTNFSVSYNEVNEELTITSTTETNIIYNESTESLTIGGAD